MRRVMVLLLLVVGPLTPTHTLRADVVDIKVRDQYLAGDELRLFVDTATFDWPEGSHVTRTRNASGWLVVVDLSKQGDLADRARVFGPLWSHKGPQSSLSFDNRMSFGPGDAAALRAIPPMTFDERGRPVRQVPAPDGAIIVEELRVNGDKAAWEKLKDGARIGRIGKDWYEGKVQNRANAILMQEETDGVIRIYDRTSGTPREDAWLAAAFQDLRSRPDFHNVHTMLTDDGNYLVASAEALHRDGPNEYREFDFEGKRCSRSDLGLVYTRGKPGPELFNKSPTDERLITSAPHGAFLIDDRLMLLDIGGSALTLRSVDGKPVYEWTPDGITRWSSGFCERSQFDAASSRIIFFDRLRDPSDQNYSEGHFPVLIWDFKKPAVRREMVEISELFDLQDGVVAPKRPATAPADH